MRHWKLDTDTTDTSDTSRIIFLYYAHTFLPYEFRAATLSYTSAMILIDSFLPGRLPVCPSLATCHDKCIYVFEFLTGWQKRIILFDMLNSTQDSADLIQEVLHKSTVKPDKLLAVYHYGKFLVNTLGGSMRAQNFNAFSQTPQVINALSAKNENDAVLSES